MVWGGEEEGGRAGPGGGRPAGRDPLARRSLSPPATGPPCGRGAARSRPGLAAQGTAGHAAAPPVQRAGKVDTRAGTDWGGEQGRGAGREGGGARALPPRPQKRRGAIGTRSGPRPPPDCWAAACPGPSGFRGISKFAKWLVPGMCLIVRQVTGAGAPGTARGGSDAAAPRAPPRSRLVFFFSLLTSTAGPPPPAPARPGGRRPGGPRCQARRQGLQPAW